MCVYFLSSFLMHVLFFFVNLVVPLFNLSISSSFSLVAAIEIGGGKQCSFSAQHGRNACEERFSFLYCSNLFVKNEKNSKFKIRKKTCTVLLFLVFKDTIPHQANGQREIIVELYQELQMTREQEDATLSQCSGAKYGGWDLVAVSLRWEYMTKPFIREQLLLECLTLHTSS